MLQIRLNPKGVASEGTGGGKSLPAETVTVACPDHLILADLPVAKSIGTTTTASVIKIVGRKSRRHLGERVHFCVCCDFPIAIYGRLIPCEHAFCLDCARSDSSCYLCEERIQKIQTIKMMEGILICAAPHCLKSFMKKSEFEVHIIENHSDLLQSNMAKEDGSRVDAFNVARPSSTESHAKQSIGMDTSTARTQPRTIFSPISNLQTNDIDDKARQNQPRDQPTPKPTTIQSKPPSFSGGNPTYPPEIPSENNTPPGFDRRGPSSRFNNQQNYDMQAGPPHWRDSDRTPDYPPQTHQPPNFVVPVNTNQGLPPEFNISPIATEGAQQFYNAQYETAIPDMPSESGPGQGSIMVFPSAPAGGNSFSEGHPPPWNMGTGMSFEQVPATQGVSESNANQPDAVGRANFFQGDYAWSGTIPMNGLMPPMGPRGLEPPRGSNVLDNNGVVTQQPRPPFPPPPNHLTQFQQGNFSGPGDAGGQQNYGWQH